MDTDLPSMTREQLMAEVRKLRDAIRAHRDASGHGLCWYQPELWALLPEKSDQVPEVPEWPVFLRGCIKFRESLDAGLPDAPRTNEEFTGD
jgi:hypothetical protein